MIFPLYSHTHLGPAQAVCRAEMGLMSGCRHRRGCELTWGLWRAEHKLVFPYCLAVAGVLANFQACHHQSVWVVRVK